MKSTILIALLSLISLLFASCGSSHTNYIVPNYTTEINQQSSGTSNSFVLIGDTQRTGWMEHYLLFRESNDSVQFALFNRIASLKSESAFIIHLGDMVYDGASDDDWIYFDEYTKVIREKKIPIIPILGNHEYMGDEKNSSHNITSRFGELKDSTWSSLTFKGIGILLLDANPELSEKMQERQKSWFNQQLSAYESDINIKHIIVTTHQPPFTNGAGMGFGDSQLAQDSFVPAFSKSKKANLFISGHCHNYENLLIDGKHYIISGGGGGPRRNIDLEGKYKDVTSGYEKNEELRNFNFVEITVNDGDLELKSHSYNKVTKVWKIGDEFEVSIKK